MPLPKPSDQDNKNDSSEAELRFVVTHTILESLFKKKDTKDEHNKTVWECICIKMRKEIIHVLEIHIPF